MKIVLTKKQKGNYIEILTDNTWDKRAKQMIDLLQNHSKEVI